MAMALLYQGMGPAALIEARQPASLLTIAPDKKHLIGQMMAKGLNCPLTSSCGRLFDAVSALLGVCLVSDYEGQAAMLLEHQAHLALDEGVPSFYPPTLREEEGITLIETAPLAALICRDLSALPAVRKGLLLCSR